MAQKRIQFNNGPAFVDLINFVPGNDYEFQFAISHDVADSVFEAAIHSVKEEEVVQFTVSGLDPTASGIVSMSMASAQTALVTQNGHWYFDEIRYGLRRTLFSGNVEVYIK